MKMNKHYNELKASYLFVDIAHKVAAYQEAHPEKEIIRLGIGDVTQPGQSVWGKPCPLHPQGMAPRQAGRGGNLHL